MAKRKSKQPDLSTRDRLLLEGAKMMAQDGFKGVSVRKICAAAETTMNMIHHFFGSKQGLLDAIVEKYDNNIFIETLEILTELPDTNEDFEKKIDALFDAILEAYMKERYALPVVIREQVELKSYPLFFSKFANFIIHGQKKGFVRKEIDPHMVTGLINDRIINQVQFAPWIKKNLNLDLFEDEKYRMEWCHANKEIILRGFLK